MCKAKKLLLISFCCLNIQAFASDIYNPLNGQITIPQVSVGSDIYTKVVVTLGGVVGVYGGTSLYNYDFYSLSTGVLTIPQVSISGSSTTYSNVAVTIGNVISFGQILINPSAVTTSTISGSI